MSETYLALTWIYSTCTADALLMAAATGGVWQGFADLGTIAPYVLVQQQSSVDDNTVNGVRIKTNKLIQIKAVGPSAIYATLAAIADRIDANFASVRDVGLLRGGILSCNREQELSYPEPGLVNGAHWENLGGLYRIQLQGV